MWKTRFIYVEYILLGVTPASELSESTFRNLVFIYLFLHFSKHFLHSANICYTGVTTLYKTNYLTTNCTFFAYLLSCMSTFYARHYLNTSLTRPFEHLLLHVLTLYKVNYLKRIALLPSNDYHTWPTLYKNLQAPHVFRTPLTIYQLMILCYTHSPSDAPVSQIFSSFFLFWLLTAGYEDVG
jgi:hypothetical protein